MKLPNLVPFAKWIVIGCFIVLCAAGLRACYYSGKVDEKLETNPPLPPKQAAAIRAQGKADAAKAAKYKEIATVATKKADTFHAIAHAATKEADSIKNVYEAIPSTARGPIATIQRRLASYQSPDTTGF